jgi:DnaJ-class molecular chaperone
MAYIITECEWCDGTGIVADQECPDCWGTGVEKTEDTDAHKG